MAVIHARTRYARISSALLLCMLGGCNFICSAIPLVDKLRSAPEIGDVSSVVEGRWDWAHREDSCRDNPHTISFSADEGYMTLFYEKPIEAYGGAERTQVKYRVLGWGSNFVRAQIVDEVRTTEDGALVAWDLVLLSEDEYCWRRTDWGRLSCTKPLVRCEEELGPVVSSGR